MHVVLLLLMLPMLAVAGQEGGANMTGYGKNPGGNPGGIAKPLCCCWAASASSAVPRATRRVETLSVFCQASRKKLESNGLAFETGKMHLMGVLRKMAADRAEALDCCKLKVVDTIPS